MHFNVFGKKIPVTKIDLTKELADGQYHPKTQSITIDKRIKGDELIGVYIHELVHAMCDRIGLHNAQLSHDLEEIIADNIATVMLENFEIKCKRLK